ncbi:MULTISPECIES: PBS lyase heat domain-containing protein repeat-containing protein [unclassified Dietzia]|uniref:PBS lyase heat domain-containing protein repeat-containing protein n=1 Tax=unclassified Dietzia TaxID=2617939 RepID=UPI000D202846|nr:MULTISPECIES: PBS lyase heat domain-containing protein repeat-containing protein [unclassified Dietzia]AVZ39321.1 PBS lyase heat domain-containing protein repeat-containing protein [Dietzia sp. JS16-p6b]QGW24576.1 PBS lyase heat domain-containing protein repeat-containing protein [Dietzia sp. DQ12-45-1b]
MGTDQSSRSDLRALEPELWPEYLSARSGLPGPRANLSLLTVAAGMADERAIEAMLADGGEYPAMCAAAALAARADSAECEDRARALATDDRWRVREGVAIGLQLLGDDTLEVLIELVRRWAEDPESYVQRVAVVAICEPRLLRTAPAAAVAIEVCRRCTDRLMALPPTQRKDPAARNLRQALGYCWSVAVAADPEPGLRAFRELPTDDPDVQWIVTQNLRKKRLSALL